MIRRALRRLLPIDLLTISFILVNIAYVFAARGLIEEPFSILSGYALCLGATALIIAIGDPERGPARASPIASVFRGARGFVRQAYPFAFLAFFFLAVTRFDTVVFKSDLDPYFAAMDTALVGSVPSSWLMAKYPSFLLSELLHGAYIVYYVSIPGLALWLYRRNKRGLSEYVFVAMLVFYAASLVYAIVPVVGGRFDPAVQAMTETYRYGPFTRAMAYIYRSSGHRGAAFPSAHAMLSLVIALIARRRARPLWPLLGINAALVLAATLYCGYHYAVDLVSGLAFVAALYPLGLRLQSSAKSGYPAAALEGSDAA
ncbi:MAG: phosphatase PAP2 family protein [Spirochaetes bacterium]|nr:phosphatase PAP2 family protein [Spirochaetota bacterium]